MIELTEWRCVGPESSFCASDDWLSNEHISLVAAVLHCISHQVMSVVHHFAIEWWQRRGARNCFAFWHIARPFPIWTALNCFRTHQRIAKRTQERSLTLEVSKVCWNLIRYDNHVTHCIGVNQLLDTGFKPMLKI